MEESGFALVPFRVYSARSRSLVYRSVNAVDVVDGERELEVDDNNYDDDDDTVMREMFKVWVCLDVGC